MSNWFRFPGEVSDAENSIEVEWDGPGWYITTRTWPGTNMYRMWLLGRADDSEYRYAENREAAARSYGGSVAWFSECPVFQEA